MSYSVREMIYTLQGEGVQSGRPAVFLRFAGCNLWSGLEKDRATAICRFCDTEFRGTDGPGGGRFDSAEELALAVAARWPGDQPGKPCVVCTGGEPLLQLDAPLIDALHDHGFDVAVESNGTLPAPEGIDWLCISPKANAPLVQTSGNELKLVYPQVEEEAQPERFEDLDFDYLLLQPMDGEDLAKNTEATLRYCLEHPRWRLSLQTHKALGIP